MTEAERQCCKLQFIHLIRSLKQLLNYEYLEKLFFSRTSFGSKSGCVRNGTGAAPRK